MKSAIKKLYLAIPFKKNIFSVLKSLVKIPPRIYQHLYFKGFFTVAVDNGRSFRMYHHGSIEENMLFWGGLENGWEKLSLDFWQRLSVRNELIVDIGANTGLYALLSASVNKEAVIHCFEPLPGVFKYLEKNVTGNNFDISIHQYALSDYNGTAEVFLHKGQDFAYSVTVNKNTLDTEQVDVLSIQTKTLATFIEEQQIPKIDLMKIDVETHEAEVLKGMGMYLEKFRPTILIEILNEDVARAVDNILSGLGYIYFNINDDKNSYRLTDKIEKSDFWNYLVCTKETAENIGLI